MAIRKLKIKEIDFRIGQLFASKDKVLLITSSILQAVLFSWNAKTE